MNVSLLKEKQENKTKSIYMSVYKTVSTGVIVQ